MQKIKNKNSIYLSGGGDENQSFSLDEYFFNSLPTGGHFLYIPVALRNTDLYLTAKHWMAKVIELHERSDLSFETVDDLLRYNNIDTEKFDAVYIGGGNTWSLMRELKDSGFSDYLIKYLDEGGFVYGGSAGAIVLGSRIDTHDDENEINYKDMSGLCLLNNFSIACHFKDVQSERFKEWSEHNNLPIICLYEETGLFIEKGSALCVGTKPCVIYHPDGSRIEIKLEEFFKL
jgi:dipeptidase E